MHRRDVNSLPSSERTELANLIRSYVSQEVLAEHQTWHGSHSSGGTLGPGSGERFLSFHRNFIGKLEDHLTQQGKGEYVPIPKWNPANRIPSEFSHSGRNTDDPQLPLPSWATIDGGTTTAPMFDYTSLRQFRSSDELGRVLGHHYHGSIHNTVGGDMSTSSSPRDPIFFPWHAFLDDLWSEWETNPQIESPIPLPTVAITRGKGGGCFIATAAYGSDLAPPVQFLREFRDDVVLQSRFRKSFEQILDVYYRFSPPIAYLMHRNKLFKHIIKYTIVYPSIALTITTVHVIKLFTKK